MNTPHDTIATCGPAVTYSGTASAVIFWGLHLSDIAVILSTVAAVVGVALQIYATFRTRK